MDASLATVLNRIERADYFEIIEIMSAVRKRFAAAFPDQEVIYISCPRNDSVQRNQTLDFVLKYFQI